MEPGNAGTVSLDRWWAGWRTAYIEAAFGERWEEDDDPRTLFEKILHSELPDEETYIVARGDHTFALLNAYPYNSGHLMVLPLRAVGDLDELSTDETAELWLMVQQAVTAVRKAYAPEGINVGLNLGKAAGAGVPDHLHVHVVPRWSGDTNFMTAVAETRVLPEPLDRTWERLKQAWPS